jgi:hypothetical protein
MSRSFADMRDCVKQAFERGSKSGADFKTMRHALIVELKRLGFSLDKSKDKLLEWNGRNERPLLPNEQKRQLLKYADWADTHICKIGCNALANHCLGEEDCSFHQRKMFINRTATKELPFNMHEAIKYLEGRYPGGGYGHGLVLKNMRRMQVEKATGEVIFVGYRAIASSIRKHDGHMMLPMSVYRRVQDLISEGMIGIVEKGKRGTFASKANGYRFLPWRSLNP